MRDPEDILYGDKLAEPAAKSHDAVDVLYRDEEKPDEPEWNFDKAKAEADAKALQNRDAKDKPRPEVIEGVAHEFAKALGLDTADAETGELATEFTTACAEAGFDTATTKKFGEMHKKASEHQSTSYWNKVWSGWAEEVKTIPADDIDAARSMVREHGDESLMDFLAESRVGDNPQLVKFLARVAKANKGKV
jgi:hypothetical protein